MSTSTRTIISQRFLRNMTLFGAPSSGKGYYGKALAKHLNVPLFTVSSILRQDPELLEHMDSGALVDCQHVCQVLQSFLQQQSTIARGFLMDGFPRTRLQIELMHEQWPQDLQIHSAFHIQVPDSVCQAKMMGRRSCIHCDRFINVAEVHSDGFDLPAMLPQCSHNGDKCQDGVSWWTRRADDSDPQIVRERLRLHRQHEEPILDFYRQHNKLFSYTPYQGTLDVPDMQTSLQAWLERMEKTSNQNDE